MGMAPMSFDVLQDQAGPQGREDLAHAHAREPAKLNSG